MATLAHGEAALVDANVKVARYKPLVAAQAVSKQQYDDASASALEAQADIASPHAAIEQARINLNYTKVLSPIAGRIGHSVVTPGALVTANQSAALYGNPARSDLCRSEPAGDDTAALPTGVGGGRDRQGG